MSPSAPNPSAPNPSATNPSSRNLSTTRKALHAVAELLIAGPQYEAHADIRLKVRPDGFGGWVQASAAVAGAAPAGAELITTTGRFPVDGSVNDLARRAGITPRPLTDVYSGGPDFSVDEPLEVDFDAAAVLLRAFIDGDAALRAFAPNEEPILWPEHFDIGVSAEEINYGVSPGDASIEEPYAYVGPWQVPSGAFWNQPFGAARRLSELDGSRGIVEFFRAGKQAAALDDQ